MVALYLAADIMLVTALRDGMNLVAKEYVASRFDDNGVLILSEFAGASDELKRSLLINPHDIDGLKDAIVRAIDMPRVERQRRMRAMRNLVLRNNVERWSMQFLEALRGIGLDNKLTDGERALDDPLEDLEWTSERIRPRVTE
jgi:trehalose 6-phosphate synthase